MLILNIDEITPNLWLSKHVPYACWVYWGYFHAGFLGPEDPSSASAVDTNNYGSSKLRQQLLDIENDGTIGPKIDSVVFLFPHHDCYVS